MVEISCNIDSQNDFFVSSSNTLYPENIPLQLTRIEKGKNITIDNENGTLKLFLWDSAKQILWTGIVPSKTKIPLIFENQTGDVKLLYGDQEIPGLSASKTFINKIFSSQNPHSKIYIALVITMLGVAIYIFYRSTIKRKKD